MHPNSLELEALAVGEANEVVETHLAECTECRAFVTKLGASTARPLPKIAKPKPQLATVIALIVPLAAAAALVFVLKRPPRDVVPPVTLPSAGASDPETTFKGGLPIAVIRERSGKQTRFTGRATIRPGDRLRVEVALDREQVISAGVLGDDGGWLQLMPESSRTAGTHFSEKSARVDSEPMRGTILVGPPERIELARSTHHFDGVSTLRLEWETP